MGLTNLILDSLMFPSSVVTISFGGSEVFDKTQDSLFSKHQECNMASARVREQGGQEERSERANCVSTAPENAMPGVREPFSPGAHQDNGITVLSKALQCTPTSDLTAPLSSAMKIQLLTLVNPFSTKCIPATRPAVSYREAHTPLGGQHQKQFR